MNWKQVLVNTLTALLVAVSSGVLVWILTKAPDNKEGLTFSVQRAGGFGSGLNHLTFYSVAIRNRGSAKAEQVDIEIATVGSGTLEEVEAQFRSPIPSGVTFKRSGRLLLVHVPTFLSVDLGRLALLYHGNVDAPEIRIRSVDGVGRRDDDLQAPRSTTQIRLQLFVGLIGFVGYIFAVKWFSRWIVTRVDFRFSRPDRNNAGFMLFHSGLIKEAHEVLSAAVASGQYDPITFSNLGGVKACLGHNEQAAALIYTASSWARDRRSRAVVLLNKAIMLYNQADGRQALTILAQALSIDAETKQYCAHSKIIAGFAENDQDLKKLLQRA